ncbi:MAG: bis(5'-nucleosyl)-tetraphosphatase (symmetrical) YqeK [Lachnospiraceae bacterium]|nr:bis(5'-nucleosyl)-tetraphosphatase (symmetrical) YqeK [Lachnospiraceae bacterium]MDD3795925.1 bis(5'-nucleosyl)-tetraphosphatase (symmetrical) YqeK [Lachnospiraceae bacterium]
MKQYSIPKIQKKLQKELDDDRYRHTLGVMYTSAALAMRYGEDLEAAQVAGLLHDCAKCIPNDKKIKMCLKNQISITEFEREAPFLLHAKLGAFLAKSKYDVNDENILQAIIWHTTGRPNMSPLEKIIFLADYIEPMRFKASNLDEVRSLAFLDMDRAIYITMRDTLQYLEKGGGKVDEMTRTACLYYKNICETDTETSETGKPILKKEMIL